MAHRHTHTQTSEPGDYEIIFADGSDKPALSMRATVHGHAKVIEPFPSDHEDYS